MIPGLEEINTLVAHQVDDPMLLREPPGPDAGPRYFSGSGFPTPRKGALTIASTMSNARRATLRSVSTQYRRSPRNSG